MSLTIAQRMVVTEGRPTGFDYLRLVLACAIVCFHSAVTCYGERAQDALTAGPARPLIGALLPMFFALSGFLVAGSLERTKTVGMFLGLRAIRIFPALAMESLIAALIVGPLLTTYPLSAYAADPRFHSYFLNILGDPHYYLPGVFETNPFSKVNAQLWTIPFELRCYLVLAVLALLGIGRRRVIALMGAAAFFVYHATDAVLHHPDRINAVHGTLPGWLFVESFLIGVAIYLYREKLPWSRTWGVLSFGIGLLLLLLPYGEAVAVFPLTYATVWLGLTNAPKHGVLKGADYSYGIFLYGFTIQQTLMHFLPWAHHWWINILLALPCATAVAAFSWYVVEKPALGLRKPLARLEAKWLAWRPKLVGGAVASSPATD